MGLGGAQKTGKSRAARKNIRVGFFVRAISGPPTGWHSTVRCSSLLRTLVACFLLQLSAWPKKNEMCLEHDMCPCEPSAFFPLPPPLPHTCLRLCEWPIWISGLGWEGRKVGTFEGGGGRVIFLLSGPFLSPPPPPPKCIHHFMNARWSKGRARL